MANPNRTTAPAPPYLHAALAAAAVFALYVVTLAPTTAFWDTSEYIATAHTMGIPHPPGNPLFVLLARSWDILLTPLGLSVAVRINLFSALMSSLAHGCWFLMVHRILAGYSENRNFPLIGAAASVLLSATAFTVWNQSNVNEKVYTVSLFTIALLSWLVMRWRDGVGGDRNDKILVLIAFLLALSVGNHLMAFLAAPAILAFVLVVRPRVLLNPRLYALALGAAALGISVHFFLPIRADRNPVINQANPKCESLSSAAVSVFTLGKGGCTALSESLGRKQYGKPSMFDDPIVAPQKMPRSPGLLARQTANYMQYFDWQWARSVRGNDNWFGGMRPLITLMFILIGSYGALTNWRRDRASFAYVGVLMLTLSFGLMFYLNFRYGFTSPWVDQLRTNNEVRERDYFFLVSFSIWGLWTGVGVAALSQRLAQTRARTLRAAPFALAVIPLFANWSWASRANDYVARDWSYNLLMSVEPYGVLVTSGDNDTFPLWYLQEVEGVRQDVTVIVMSYLNTDWYAKQLRDLTRPCPRGTQASDDRTTIVCQRAYVPPLGTDLYATSDGARDSARVANPSDAPGTRRPRHSILELTDEQIDTTSRTAFISPGATYRAGNVVTEIPRGSEIMPADIFLAQIITSSIDDRPIFFASTTNGYASLGLQHHLVQRGAAFKLVNGAVAADPVRGIYDLPIGGGFTPHFIDAPATEQLLTQVFVHHPGFPDEWGHFTDVATQDIPMLYAQPLQFLAYTYAMRGDSVKAQKLADESERFRRLSNVRAREAARGQQ